MPKVSEEYLKNKKNLIIDAASRACKKKPLNDVTIQDIINESGLSQGGIYRFYKDIDDIFVALFNRYYSKIDFREDVEQILRQNKNPEEVIREIFVYLIKFINAHLDDYHKLCFELNTMTASNAQRANKIIPKLEEQHSYAFLIERCFQFVVYHTQMGYFHPKITLEQIFSFVLVSYDGIQRDLIISKCYKPDAALPAHVNFDTEQLMVTLCEAMLIFLGVEV